MTDILNELKMKRYILILVGIYITMAIKGQHINVAAPSRVNVGENFRVAYTVSTQDVDDFRSNMRSTDEVEVIAGPYASKVSSFSMVNGHTTSSSSITYTYTLYANKAGIFTVPAAHAKIHGKTIASHSTKITISGQARSNNNNAHNNPNTSAIHEQGSRISGNELFIKVSANKRKVHEQEPILLTYKVYTTLELTQLEGKMPDLTGFHTQEVKLPQQKSFHIERVNGRPYRCVTWSQYVMYPQMTGSLKIPSITFHGIVVQENRSVDPFEAFFNGGSGYVEVKRHIAAPGLSVEVEPLPTKPANFSGGVGKFNISAQVDNKDIKAGEPLNFRVVIGGYGNLKLIKQPVVKFPKDFDQYDAKITDKTKLTSNGLEGNMIYDFLAVPRNQGNYTIPPVELVYYDVDRNQYRTVKTQAINLQIAKGDGKSGSVSDYAKDQNTDIRGIKEGGVTIKNFSSMFFGSVAYWTSLIIVIVIFVVLLVVFRKRAVLNADVVRIKGKKANRIATKRLRKASKLMIQGKSEEFYDEVLRALWGYVGDKLNMAIEELSRDNISQTLANHSVDDATIQKFTDALTECEFERFAPGDPAGNMNKTFESAMTAIIEIERVMKKKNRINTKALLVVMALAVSCQVGAVTKENADKEYKRGNYQQAIQDYQELLKSGKSPEIYYNLGNAYFRSDNISQSILAYERALLLSPGDADVRFNLKFARNKTIDKIVPEDQMFFKTWYQSLVFYTGIDSWAIVSLVSIIGALSLVLFYLFGNRVLVRKVGFYGALVLIVVTAFSMLFAQQQKEMLLHRTGAIIISSTVNVKKTPAPTSTDVYVLHEGTKVDITDQSIEGWYGIKLADGREGWIKSSSLEKI